MKYIACVPYILYIVHIAYYVYIHYMHSLHGMHTIYHGMYIQFTYIVMGSARGSGTMRAWECLPLGGLSVGHRVALGLQTNPEVRKQSRKHFLPECLYRDSGRNSFVIPYIGIQEGIPSRIPILGITKEFLPDSLHRDPGRNPFPNPYMT